MNMRISFWGTMIVTLATVNACGNGTGPTTESNDEGTGSMTLLVTAQIDGNDAPGGIDAVFLVTLRDSAGGPVSGATVTINNDILGEAVLVELTVGSGNYKAAQNGLPDGDFVLNVVLGADNIGDVMVSSPGIHGITGPVENQTVVALDPLTVTWNMPLPAQSAEVETHNFQSGAVPDTGLVIVPGPLNPKRKRQRIRVYRYNEVVIAGGLPGSMFRIQVRQTVEPVEVQ